MYTKRIEELEAEITLHKLNAKILQSNCLKMRDLLVKFAILSGIRYDTKEYKEVVLITGIKPIVLYKINHGIAMSDAEKKYVTEIIEKS